MKKILSVFLMVVLASAVLFAGGNKEEMESMNRLEKIMQSGKITCAISPDFAPYEFLDLTNPEHAVVGAEVSLAKYIADALGVELVIEQMDFATCQASVAMGKIDFTVSGYAPTAERAENMGCSTYYNFTPVDESDSKQGVIVAKKNAGKCTTAEDFKGMKLAVQNGSLQMNLATSQLEDVTLEPISNINDGILMLLNGKVDGVVSSTDTGMEYVKNYPDSIDVAPFRFVFQADGNIALVNKNEPELLDAINKAIEKAKAENALVPMYEEAKALCDKLGVKVN